MLEGSEGSEEEEEEGSASGTQKGFLVMNVGMYSFFSLLATEVVGRDIVSIGGEVSG